LRTAYGVFVKKGSLGSSPRKGHFLDLSRIYRAKLWIFLEPLTQQQYPSSLTEEVLTRGYSHACECCIIMYKLEKKTSVQFPTNNFFGLKITFEFGTHSLLRQLCAHITSWNYKIN
jgi:hypothetical protein